MSNDSEARWEQLERDMAEGHLSKDEQKLIDGLHGEYKDMKIVIDKLIELLGDDVIDILWQKKKA